jgi:hypothetical protein
LIFLPEINCNKPAQRKSFELIRFVGETVGMIELDQSLLNSPSSSTVNCFLLAIRALKNFLDSHALEGGAAKLRPVARLIAD